MPPQIFSVPLDALDSLAKEINPDSSPTSASKEYRKSVALGLFYKVRCLVDRGAGYDTS